VGLDDFGFPMLQNELSFVPAESQPEANGATTASQEPDTQLPLVNGIAKGGSTSLEAYEQEPRPHGLYDTDLEKMHTDLYKRKYLTPNDFLDDIRKIVHNTYLRFEEDAERFYKAQAMLTAAQVSINEFDLQLRQDCDRMAARERKRREERMRNREKEKGPDESANHGHGNGFGYAPGTRRSARQNGQQLEISISDPLKIERRRKRQRAGGEAATDSQGSEGDTSDGRTSKRSKMAVSDDEDPLNNLGLGPTSQPRPLVVRFTGAGAESPSHGREHSTAVQQEDVLPLLTTAMEVDQESVTPRRGGFDPFLLNPMPMPASLPLLVSKSSSSSSSDPFSAGPALFLHDSVGAPEDPFDVVPSSSIPVDHLSQPSTSAMQTSRTATPTPSAATLEPQPQSQPRKSPTPTPVPIIVDPPIAELVRTPTPVPMPDFIVDPDKLSRLKHHLPGHTDLLSVEELEQLRAMCLGCIWRHRVAWDRGQMLDELETILFDFVREIKNRENEEPFSVD
jgi:hypothetical protein